MPCFCHSTLVRAPSAKAIEVRSEVSAFARIMEQKLRENEHKGHWSDCGPEWLFKRLKQEVSELKRAVDRDGSPEVIAREAADVANFAMMIADIYDGLPKF